MIIGITVCGSPSSEHDPTQLDYLLLETLTEMLQLQDGTLLVLQGIS